MFHRWFAWRWEVFRDRELWPGTKAMLIVFGGPRAIPVSRGILLRRP
jgi:hypothetical protein